MRLVEAYGLVGVVDSGVWVRRAGQVRLGFTSCLYQVIDGKDVCSALIFHDDTRIPNYMAEACQVLVDGSLMCGYPVQPKIDTEVIGGAVDFSSLSRQEILGFGWPDWYPSA